MSFQRKKQAKNNSKAYSQPHGNAKSQNTKSVIGSGVIADTASHLHLQLYISRNTCVWEETLRQVIFKRKTI